MNLIRGGGQSFHMAYICSLPVFPCVNEALYTYMIGVVESKHSWNHSEHTTIKICSEYWKCSVVQYIYHYGNEWRSGPLFIVSYTLSLYFKMGSHNLNKLIISSLFLFFEKICQILQYVCKKEGLSLPAELAQRIAEKSGRNLRRALLICEACRVQQ